MAKIILVDDNGSTIEQNFDSILEATRSDVGHRFLMEALKNMPVGDERSAILQSIKNDMVSEFFHDYFYCCDCGNVTLMASVVRHDDGISCQACANTLGTQRYNELVKRHGRTVVTEYFAGWQADAEMDDDAREELVRCYTRGVTAEPAIVVAGIKNQLNELDDEDWYRVQRDLED